MVELTSPAPARVATADAQALRNYYLLRAGVAGAWIAAALLAGRHSAAVAGVLLVAYPAWDALANLGDAARSGGLRRNPAQAFNALFSAATAVGVALSLADPHRVLAIFGVWAGVAGLLQLAAGVGRWRRYGAQWAMVLSGAQSALAGVHFVTRAFGAATPGIIDIVPYAAFGTFYFLVSAIALTLRRR